MKVLELTGVVDSNDPEYNKWRVENIEGPLIGGRFVIEAIRETFDDDRVASLKGVTVTLACGGDEHLYRGDGYACEGDNGYSALTPGEPPDIYVGGVDLIEKLS